MNYNINILKKNVKNITIKIKNSKTVLLTVPKHISEVTLNEILIKKKLWIEKNIEKLYAREKLSSKAYNDGDNFSFLGVFYPLKLLVGNHNSFTLENNLFSLVFSENNISILSKEKIFNNWYKLQAQSVFEPILNHFLFLTNQEISILKFSFMKTRWGSCNFFKKSINLNLELLKTPISLIEYVILHEICHLKFPNHQKEFWDYLEVYMPDWKLRRKQLRDFSF